MSFVRSVGARHGWLGRPTDTSERAITRRILVPRLVLTCPFDVCAHLCVFFALFLFLCQPGRIHQTANGICETATRARSRLCYLLNDRRPALLGRPQSTADYVSICNSSFTSRAERTRASVRWLAGLGREPVYRLWMLCRYFTYRREFLNRIEVVGSRIPPSLCRLQRSAARFMPSHWCVFSSKSESASSKSITTVDPPGGHPSPQIFRLFQKAQGGVRVDRPK